MQNLQNFGYALLEIDGVGGGDEEVGAGHVRRVHVHRQRKRRTERVQHIQRHIFHSH